MLTQLKNTTYQFKMYAHLIKKKKKKKTIEEC
jgi:hypothetical protein